MPRKAEVSHNEILTELKETPAIFNEDGNLVTATSDVWIELCRKFKSRLKPKYLHFYVQRDRHGVLRNLRDHFNIVKERDHELAEYNTPSLSSLLLSSDTDDVNSGDDDMNSGDDEKIIRISPQDWISIKPVEDDSCNENTEEHDNFGQKLYRSLRPSVWTQVISEQIWKQLKIPCPFLFKRSKVSVDCLRSRYYCTIQGQCKECSNRIKAFIKEKPQDGSDVVIHLQMEDTKGVPHVKKRPLKGEIRKKVGQELLTATAKTWRVKSANKNMEFGDVLPPHLYSSDVLRKAKQETKDKSFGFKGEDPLQGLSYMKRNLPWAGSIYDIGLDKFYVHYWTPSQMFLYKKYLNKSEYTRVAIDATGSLVRKVRHSKGEFSRHIFLYEVVVNVNKRQFSVSQMLSEKHDTLAIAYWLGQWMRAGASPPHEAVCDFSLALLGAISRAFNGISLNIYIRECFESIQQHHQVPSFVNTFIRLDVAHFMRMISKWSCLSHKSIPKRVKEFYLFCVGLLVNAKDLPSFEHLLSQIIVIAVNETYGEEIESTELTPAEMCKRTLLHLISSSGLNQNEFSLHDDAVNKNEYEDTNESSADINTTAWVNEQWRKASENITEGKDINPFYNPDFSKELKRISDSFLLWSAVMNDKFKSPFHRGSSASVEGDFGDMKTRMLRNENKLLRVDKFVKLHIEYLEGCMKLIEAERGNDECLLYKEKLWREKEISDKIMKPPSSETKCNVSEEVESTYITASDYTEQLVFVEDVHTLGSKRNESAHKIVDENKEEAKRKPDCFVGSNSQEIKAEDHWKKTKKRRTKYFRDNPDIRGWLVSPGSSNSGASIKLAKNGSLCKPIVIGKETVSVKCTCPFDSVLQSLSTAIIDFESYLNYTKTSTNVTIQLALKLLNASNNKSEFYKGRAKYLSGIYPKSESPIIPDLLNVDATDNVISFLEKTFTDAPSFTITKLCPECSATKIQILPVLRVNRKIIMSEGLKKLQTAIEEHIKTDNVQFCKTPKCNGVRSIKCTFGQHLFIELDFLDPENRFLQEMLTSKEVCNSFKLSDFPVELTVDGSQFRLCSVIAHVPGHYIAYCYRTSRAWEIHDDLQSCIKQCKGDLNVNPHSVLYLPSQEQ